MNDVLDGLTEFLTVARERSFTRAAAKLGIAQPTLSQTVRALEDRLGVRLLIRTTRSVSPTEAGERLLQTAGPRLDDIRADLEAMRELRDKPAGTFRISAIDFTVDYILWPKLAPFLEKYPDIKIEITIDYAMTDIAATGYDAGVRLGGVVAKDMIAVPLTPHARFAVVGSPSYFERHPAPTVPQDLTGHRCINLRLPTYGNLYAWEFEKDGQELRVRVDGQVVFNGIFQVLNAALDGFGLAFIPETMAAPHLEAGRLRRVLEEWCPYWEGYHLYYPTRRQSSPAFALLVEVLRYREQDKAMQSR
ncbi:LysR family transcriptional regulator [Rhizobium leucaenae]|uniref:HTH-type transcriptional regulator TtuA n=1 Tax=Rhizobium leucaenae TaxID=29450 RepID=A0A7W7EMR5_9HYPH|nr:LysR family transcriptional regulator [Rhizobium leucaenae]MBB4570782.1 DNA-binding transcriptional LysR family regulator [Rhizobium leucaenae]